MSKASIISPATVFLRMALNAAEDAVGVALGRYERAGRPGQYVTYLNDDGDTIIQIFKQGA